MENKTVYSATLTASQESQKKAVQRTGVLSLALLRYKKTLVVGWTFLKHNGNNALHQKFKKLCYFINWRWNNAEDFNCRR